MTNTNKDDAIKAKEMNSKDSEQAEAKVIFTDDERKIQFYEKLRQKVRKYTNDKGGKAGVLAEYLFLLPDLFILVTRLAMDSRVPAKKKLFIGAVVTYMILPLDIVPDFIPVLGHIDDLVVSVFGLNMILNDIDKDVLVDNWSGKGNILELLQTISAKAEQFMDKNFMQRIKKWINKNI